MARQNEKNGRNGKAQGHDKNRGEKVNTRRDKGQSGRDRKESLYGELIEQNKMPPLTCLGVSLRPLKPQQRIFVIELFQNGFDATAAAEYAGYAKPNVASARLMKEPQVKRVVEKIQRKVSRYEDLKVADVLQELSKAVFRDIRDLYDDEGNLIPVRELEDHVASVVDSVQEKMRYDKRGNPVSKTVEYKMIPKSAALDMALKVTGAYAAEKHEHSMTVDWDQLLEPPKDADKVERQLEEIELDEADYEVTKEQDN